MLENVKLYANKCLILDVAIGNRQNQVKLYNCVKY